MSNNPFNVGLSLFLTTKYCNSTILSFEGIIFLVSIIFAPFPAHAQESINPFWPRTETTVFYGSGDVDSSGIIDGNDYALIQSGIQNDMADIDGDGIPATDVDISMLGDYLDGNISYLPGHWKYLQTREERDDWIDKTMEIDPTDTMSYIPGEFTSWGFGGKTHGNFYGIPDTANAPYDMSDNQRFNIPLFYVQVINLSTYEGHGMNAILTRDNPLNFNDWNFVEPQNDNTNVQIGSQSIPYNRFVGISKIEGFNEIGGTMKTPLVAFNTNNEGEEPTLYTQSQNYPNGYNLDLMLTRPTVGIKEKPEITDNYILGQNYPNPFNNSTTINYSLPFAEKVELSVYDIQEKKLETIVNSIQSAGKHKINFNSDELSSGIYLYRLNTESGRYKTGKMTSLK